VWVVFRLVTDNMPFKSKAQMRWMFKQHPEMAHEWASKTDAKKLPERVKPKKKEDKKESKSNDGPNLDFESLTRRG